MERTAPAKPDISGALREKGDPKKAAWWERYLKGEILFLGVGLPEIRKILGEMNRTENLDTQPLNRQVGIVNGLMRGEYAEQKLAAILFMQLFWLGRQKNSLIMGMVSDWFDERYLYDWNTTDWLCVKLLTPLVDSGDATTIRHLKRWNRDPYLWKARASLIPFALASTIMDHAKDIRRFASVLIRRDERFAKTAVGWVMRECSRHDPEFVLDFLSRHAAYTTAEVKRNALKYYRQHLRSV